LIYLCFLVGFRTRLMHVLSWFSLLSLNTRATMLANGGDYVFCTLLLWSAFLPLGASFSIDRWLAQTRDPDAPEPQPVKSLAALALLLQIAVIYFFNAAHKTGSTWREGSAVYYMLHQARIVTVFGLWVRDHVPLPLLQALSYATLVIEWTLPLLIMSPWLLWPRRLAFALIWSFHGSIALLANLGLFSPVMMVFSAILLGPADWEWLERRLGAHVERLRTKLGPVLGWLAARTSAAPVRPPSAALHKFREVIVAALMVCALSQITVENEAVPDVLRPPQPAFMDAAISYLRLNQGWGMFAPDAPREDMTVVVDAVTVDGRHIDPYNMRASVIADPRMRELPDRLGQNYLYCDYTARIEDTGLFHESLREWILAHHRRTKRPQDKIISFAAYIVEDTSPKPGEATPTNRKARKFLSGKASP
ncbi:MAG TPA: HTTM domain-containing protein, partial [Polyangiales bacterium]|nr:HTTM domain-containing protein [Polyangiales bacterium]